VLDSVKALGQLVVILMDWDPPWS